MFLPETLIVNLYLYALGDVKTLVLQQAPVSVAAANFTSWLMRPEAALAVGLAPGPGQQSHSAPHCVA